MACEDDFRIGADFRLIKKSRILAWPRLVTKMFAGFDVAMDNSLGVGGFQSIGYLDAKIQKFVRGDGSRADSLSSRVV